MNRLQREPQRFTIRCPIIQSFMQYFSKRLLLPIYVTVVLCIASCSPHQTMSDHIQTTQAGINSLPWPKQMETLFGEGDHFITYYGVDSKPKLWNSEVFFGGRYKLTLQVEVEINYWKHKIVKIVSPPKFYLLEVDSTIRDNVGTGSISSRGWELAETQWEKLVEAKGDWSVIDIPVKTNDPVARFEDYVKGQREPRDKIPH